MMMMMMMVPLLPYCECVSHALWAIARAVVAGNDGFVLSLIVARHCQLYGLLYPP